MKILLPVPICMCCFPGTTEPFSSGLREAESLTIDNTAADQECDPGHLNRGSLLGPSDLPLEGRRKIWAPLA